MTRSSVQSPQPAISPPRYPHLLRVLNGPTVAPAWVLPVLTPYEQISTVFDAKLTRAALAARAGDQCAHAALYQALTPRLARSIRRYQHGRWQKITGRAWDQADIEQEAYLVFANLLDTWSGEGSFCRYLLGHFAWRLATAVRRLHGERPTPSLRLDRCWTLRDESAAAAEALALLETLAAGLPPVDRAILLGHIRDGESFGALAHRLQINRRTVRRRWLRLLAQLRTSLEVSRPHERTQ